MRWIAALVVLILALPGCVSDDGLTGTGPVTLTDRQQSSFEKWANGTTARDPLYFFLIRGGSSYWVYCPDSVAICRDDREEDWKQKCDAKHGTDACKLYGVYGDVVWKLDEPADPSWSNDRDGFRVTRTRSTPGEDVRQIEVRWAGYAGTLNGTLHYKKSQRNYELIILIPGEAYCDGMAEFTRKTWTISCRNDRTAKGTFRPVGDGKGSIGEGLDSRGNRIEFRVTPAKS